MYIRTLCSAKDSKEVAAVGILQRLAKNCGGILKMMRCLQSLESSHTITRNAIFSKLLDHAMSSGRFDRTTCAKSKWITGSLFINHLWCFFEVSDSPLSLSQPTNLKLSPKSISVCLFQKPLHWNYPSVTAWPSLQCDCTSTSFLSMPSWPICCLPHPWSILLTRLCTWFGLSSISLS